MRKFVVLKTSTVKVDAEQARVERAAVMAAMAGVANSLGLSWSPPLKKRVWRPSRRIGFHRCCLVKFLDLLQTKAFAKDVLIDQERRLGD